MKKTKINIEGIHCKSCKTLIESEIDVLAGVKEVEVNHQTGQTTLEFDDQKISKTKIFKAIEKLNYKVKQNSPTPSSQDDNFSFWITVAGVALVFLVVYLIIQQTGALELMSKLNEGNIGYGLVFLIGLLASFHCVGMCGGIVVAYTSTSKNKSSLIHWQYNLGRIVSYTTIGALLGGIGSFFAINPSFNGIILILAALFMVLMGISLGTKLNIPLPQFIARFLYNQKHSKKPKGPFIIGLINGLMPCGPLQAMQLYALTTGSLTKGALSMAFYALGTAPLLFGLGKFVSFISKDKIKQFMRLSGIIVIILGLLMLNRGLTNFGYGLKSFIPDSQTVSESAEGFQTVNMTLNYKGYTPNVLYIKKDIPVRWVINAEQISGCTDSIIMPDYDIEKNLKKGENIIEFTPTEVGEIKFSCWMQMVWGKFIVVDSNEELSTNTSQPIKTSSSNTCSPDSSCDGSCGTSSCGCGNK